MGDMEWTNDLVIRLVTEYRKRPELWDSTHDLYRVHTAKYEAWSELANLFECDIADLRKKFNSIFASHRREKTKVRCGGRSTWFLYSHMSFLPTHVDNNESTPAEERRRRILKLSTEETEQFSPENEYNDDNDENDGEEDEEDAQEIVIKTEPRSNTYLKPREIEYVQCRKPRAAKLIKRKIIKKNNQGDKSRLIETIRLLRRSDLLKKKDECDSFGEYIADSLRKHDERTQSMIKQAINNILFEQEMKKYSTSQYNVVVSGIDENPLILGGSGS